LPYPVVIAGNAEAAALRERLGAAAWVARGREVEAGAAPSVWRLGPLLAAVMDELDAGAGADVVGARLHATVAAFVLDACSHVRRATGLAAVALVGGVFQNRLLGRLCEDGLAAAGFDVLAGGLAPCNDGGLALGQAAVAGYTVLERRGEYAPPKP
jgi:hydrogenase maturation factor HypF (carbamoyltransferase family)